MQARETKGMLLRVGYRTGGARDEWVAALAAILEEGVKPVQMPIYLGFYSRWHLSRGDGRSARRTLDNGAVFWGRKRRSTFG